MSMFGVAKTPFPTSREQTFAASQWLGKRKITALQTPLTRAKLEILSCWCPRGSTQQPFVARPSGRGLHGHVWCCQNTFPDSARANLCHFAVACKTQNHSLALTAPGAGKWGENRWHRPGGVPAMVPATGVVFLFKKVGKKNAVGATRAIF